MATESFFDDLILDTPEAVANMEKAVTSQRVGSSSAQIVQ